MENCEKWNKGVQICEKWEFGPKIWKLSGKRKGAYTPSSDTDNDNAYRV